MGHCCHTHPSSLDETMRLKSVLLNGIIHEGGCSGVAWRGDASLVSCGEDHTIRYLRPDLDKTAQEERRFAKEIFLLSINQLTFTMSLCEMGADAQYKRREKTMV